MSDANRLLFLRIALIVIGLTFIFGIYTLGILWPSGWAWGQTFAPSNDDHWSVRDAGRVFDHRLKKSLRSQEPHLVHRMVERGSWGDHGRSGPQRSGRARSSGRRCARAYSRCDHTCSVDAARTAQA
jgi:hypothetical protein